MLHLTLRRYLVKKRMHSGVVGRYQEPNGSCLPSLATSCKSLNCGAVSQPASQLLSQSASQPGLLSIWWKCLFVLSKMPSYILWQNALFKNTFFYKSILSRNIEGHFWKSKRAFHICSLQTPSYTTWQNAFIHNTPDPTDSGVWLTSWTLVTQSHRRSRGFETTQRSWWQWYFITTSIQFFVESRDG